MPSDSPAAILFDVDGTLMDDDRAVSISLVSFHFRHGPELDISANELVTRWSELMSIHFTRYLRGEISMQEQRRARIVDLFSASKLNLSAEMADRIFAAYESDYRSSWSTYPDALPVLKMLGGYVLAVLTNGDLAQQTQKLQISGTASHFSMIFASSDIGFSKPAPEAFAHACRRLDISPQRCMYVGDSLDTDARGSTAAGLMGVWLDRAASGTDPGPEIRVIQSLSALPDLIDAKGKR
jgi:putative hydrolase of the HAD superfamily